MIVQSANVKIIIAKYGVHGIHGGCGAWSQGVMPSALSTYDLTGSVLYLVVRLFHLFHDLFHVAEVECRRSQVRKVVLPERL